MAARIQETINHPDTKAEMFQDTHKNVQLIIKNERTNTFIHLSASPKNGDLGTIYEPRVGAHRAFQEKLLSSIGRTNSSATPSDTLKILDDF